MSVTRSRNASSSERKGRRSSPQTRPRNQGDGSLARDACCVPVATRSLSFRRTHHEPGRQPPVGMIDRTRKTQLPSLVHHHRGYRVAICTQSGHFAEITPPGDNSRVIRHDTTPSSTSAFLLSGWRAISLPLRRTCTASQPQTLTPETSRGPKRRTSATQEINQNAARVQIGSVAVNAVATNWANPGGGGVGIVLCAGRCAS